MKHLLSEPWQPFFNTQSEADRKFFARRLHEILVRRTKESSGFSLADSLFLAQFAKPLSFFFNVELIEGYGHRGCFPHRRQDINLRDSHRS